MLKKLVAMPTEDEIKSFWKHKDRVYISIVCTCFNQQKYIKDALDSFLAQKTEYAFEIIVHDDASTDNTPLILKDYETRYPTILKVIYQTENQYSKGNMKVESIAVEQSRGDFIAICEGDDFWIDESKLQLQISALLEQPQASLCFTSAYSFFSDGKTAQIANYSQSKSVIPTKDVILGGGDYIPTPSILITRKAMTSLPDWFQSAPVGDVFIQIQGAQNFGALYLPNITAAYRVASEGSWSSSQILTKEAVIKSNVNKLVQCYELLAVKSPYQKEYKQAILNLYVANALKAITQKRYALAKYFINKFKVLPATSPRKKVLQLAQFCLPLFRVIRKVIQPSR